MPPLRDGFPRNNCRSFRFVQITSPPPPYFDNLYNFFFNTKNVNLSNIHNDFFYQFFIKEESDNFVYHKSIEQC